MSLQDNLIYRERLIVLGTEEMNENEDLIGIDGKNPAGMETTFIVATVRRIVSIDVDGIIKYQ